MTRRTAPRRPLDRVELAALRAWARPWRRDCLCRLADVDRPCGRMDAKGNETGRCVSWPTVADRARLTTGLGDDDLAALNVLERLIVGRPPKDDR